METATAEKIAVGSHVKFVDPYAVEHDAIVTTLFDNNDPEKYPNPSVNVVYASSDDSKTDQYGRQIERNTSVVHKSNQFAHGMYWRRLSE